jgi:uncharacterized protein (TIGR03083 family)
MANADAHSRMKALHNSHDHLGALIDALDPGQLTARSYCDDWTIAQVLSHLGSGAEVFSLMAEAGVAGTEPPGPHTFPPIWDAWNSKSPELQAADSKEADQALVEQLEALDEQQLEKFHLSMFGMEVDAARLIGMRLSEHSLHTWDVEVALDPSAKLAPDATALLLDGLSERVPRSGKAVGGPMRVRIDTTAPARSFVLIVDESVSLDEVPEPGSGGDGDDAAGGATARIVLPAEALLRLVSGRLDDGHLPADLRVTGVTLQALRGVFPGF